MGMNPDTNRMEHLAELERALGEAEAGDAARLLDEVRKGQTARDLADQGRLVRPDGTPVPKHWSVFRVGEVYEVNGYLFRCAYVGETSILLEPHGPVVVGAGPGSQGGPGEAT